MISILLSMGFAASYSNALPMPVQPRNLVELPASFTADFDFEGIIELSNCSGSLVRFENSKDDDMAMVLTNGHCYEGGFIRPGTFLYNQTSSRSFNLMNSSGGSAGRLRASHVLYATMTRTDMSLYKVRSTYAQIKQDFNVRPFTIASQHAVAGQAIQVISGYWQRGYSCTIETFINRLDEEGWSWLDSMRYSRPGCEVIGGTSGSPVIATGTRLVVGVNNTGNEDGKRCTRNNPCEIDEAGEVTYQKGYSYGQEVNLVYTCLGPNNQIDLTIPGCLLPH